MNSSRSHVLDSTSVALVSALKEHQASIVWAEGVFQLFDSIKKAYILFSELPADSDDAWMLHDRVKDLERYIVMDLERHIATCNGRSPYYMACVQRLLVRVQQATQARGAESNGVVPSHVSKEQDHLIAELQAAFMEYGFCQSYDALTDIGEITRRLTTLNVKLESLEASLVEPTLEEAAAALAITEIHDALAQQHGIQQAATQENMSKVQGLYDKLTGTIARLENNVCRTNIRADSKVLQAYVKQQSTLRNSCMHSLFHCEPEATLNSHTIHPGTRAWLLEAIHKCYANTKISLIYIQGKQGVGKSALAAQVCKHYGADAVAAHFFNSLEGVCTRNSVSGLIQSLAVEMCKTMPEYAAYLMDKYAGNTLADSLNGHWLGTYRTLFKEPFAELYGGKSRSTHHRRRIMVVDGVDESNQSEWTEMKHFLTTCMKELPRNILMLVTVRSKFFSNLVPTDVNYVEGIRLEERQWQMQHIKDIEIYMSSSMGAILSGEDDGDAPSRAKADEHTLQNTMDELLKYSAGRFDYAIEVMESFARQMRMSGGQFLSSVKKSLTPVRRAHPQEFDSRSADFSSPFRSYRDREGRSVAVRIMRQSLYPMDKTRVALIRGRQRELSS